MPMYPLPPPPLRMESIFGEGRRIAQTAAILIDSPPPAMSALALVLLATWDSQRWQDGDPAAWEAGGASERELPPHRVFRKYCYVTGYGTH